MNATIVLLALLLLRVALPLGLLLWIGEAVQARRSTELVHTAGRL